ncbi:hypothetical protein F5141DRAFT_78627 [Pisolithus sp. B1]|nr:hypothetical protein F5141DRAFT_78627 [Pisolithus sp. B1]
MRSAASSRLTTMHASYHGFTRCGTYPRKFTGDAVTLSSLTNDLVVVVYANRDAGSYFAVGLGYYLGQGWVHIVYDEHLPKSRDVDWRNFGKRAYDRMWCARAEHARNMFEHEHTYLTRNAWHFIDRARFTKDAHLIKDARFITNTHFVTNAHLPRSIWAARVVWGRWEADNFNVMVDVEQCPGCCDGPWRMTTTLNDWGGLAMPGLMNTICCPYLLKLDGWVIQVVNCSGQRIQLGDYGDRVNGILIRSGNIFEDMRILDINHEDPAYFPVVSGVSSDTRFMYDVRNQADVAIAYHTAGDTHLALHQAKGISLPANERFVLLLKTFSTRLAGKHLVTTTIQCSDFYIVDKDAKRRDSGDDLAPDNGMHATEPRIFTPFCAIASPQVWRRELPCVQRREQFKNIREHFYALYPATGTESCHRSANRRKTERAAKFFSDLFGLKYLRNYIGEITFFAKLPRMVETDSPSDVLSVCAAEEDGLLPHPPILSCANWLARCSLLRGSHQSDAVQSDARHEVVLPLLHRRCQTLRTRYDARHRYATEKQKVEYELKSILQTLGADLLEHIADTFRNRGSEHSAGFTGQASSIKYDRRLDAPSIILEIEALQGKLNITEDEDEQRALEEDVTGKILWLCWCGICAEVDELLPKVVGYLWREENMEGFAEMTMIMMSTKYAPSPGLRGILSTHPGDDQAHLRRTMFDAGVRTSKHQLLLAARAAEKAKWSGVNMGAYAMDDEGTTRSTSSHAPSVSVV